MSLYFNTFNPVACSMYCVRNLDISLIYLNMSCISLLLPLYCVQMTDWCVLVSLLCRLCLCLCLCACVFCLSLLIISFYFTLVSGPKMSNDCWFCLDQPCLFSFSFSLTIVMHRSFASLLIKSNHVSQSTQKRIRRRQRPQQQLHYFL